MDDRTEFEKAIALLADAENKRREWKETVDRLPALLAVGLRDYRTGRNLSQKELAAELGVNYTYISKIENQTPVPESIRASLIAFFVRVNFLRDDGNRLTVVAGN
jgi:DNA-binding XRE family transcriptional regulator